MKKIQNVAAFIFMISVAILSVVSIFGVWKIFSNDVIIKSFQTLGLLALVAVIVMVAGYFMDDKSKEIQTVESLPNPLFKTIRKSTLVVLIASVSVLALLGVLTIWDVITNKDVLYKSLSSVFVLAFGSLLIVMTGLNRENNQMFKNTKVSAGAVVLVIILIYIFINMFGIFR